MWRLAKTILPPSSKAIDASAADRSKTVPPFALSVSLGQIMAVAADA